jgi:Tol biopolymer transport system component
VASNGASGSSARRAAALLVCVAVLAAGGCSWVTRASVDTAGGDPNSSTIDPSISRDGRYVAFTSGASDLVPGDGNDLGDVYVRDLQTGTTVRASVDATGGDSDNENWSPSLSADGRYVAFVSRASDLGPSDDNGFEDVYVRDLQTGTTVRASVGATGGDSDGQSNDPVISGDGRRVAFRSEASNLVTDDGNELEDVFVRDLQSGTTVRASLDTAGGDPNGASSLSVTMSADGRYVAFASEASDLVPGDGNGLYDVFVRDLQAATTTRVSVDTAGGDPDDASEGAAISADARYVAFASRASDLVPGDGKGFSDVFVRDLTTNTTTRLSVDTAGGDADHESYAPSISADGRYVGFTSFATDLIAHDGNDFADVFLRDRQLGRTIRVSQDLVHREGNRESGHEGGAALSADGRFMAFDSLASNLVPDDGNDVHDVFVKYARQVEVTGITPDDVARGATNVPVTISGIGFEPGSVVQVHRSGSEDITLGNITVVNERTVTAQLSLPADAAIGAWDVRVWHVAAPGFAVGQCGGCLRVG